MSDIYQFEEWCKQLAEQTGLSYPLVFKPHLRQIKDKWNAFNKETAVSVNEVMVTLLQYGCAHLLAKFAELLFPQMQAKELLNTRLRLCINCGIALNMQNKLDDSELMYRTAMDLIDPLYHKEDSESFNIIASLHYNYSRLQLSKGNKEISEHIEEAIKYFTLGGYHSGLASTYSLKAIILPASASTERIQLFLQAAELNRESGAANDYAMRLANVGVELINIHEFKQGIEYLQRALSINLQNNSSHHLGINYLMLADAYFKSNDVEQAKGFCEIAKRELQKANILSYKNEIDALEQSIHLALKK